jgi:hypothetical protein
MVFWVRDQRDRDHEAALAVLPPGQQPRLHSVFLLNVLLEEAGDSAIQQLCPRQPVHEPLHPDEVRPATEFPRIIVQPCGSLSFHSDLP